MEDVRSYVMLYVPQVGDYVFIAMNDTVQTQDVSYFEVATCSFAGMGSKSCYKIYRVLYSKRRCQRFISACCDPARSMMDGPDLFVICPCTETPGQPGGHTDSVWKMLSPRAVEISLTHSCGGLTMVYTNPNFDVLDCIATQLSTAIPHNFREIALKDPEEKLNWANVVKTTQKNPN